jgi:hypothetical protein
LNLLRICNATRRLKLFVHPVVILHLIILIYIYILEICLTTFFDLNVGA